jgi:hypothetical protein
MISILPRKRRWIAPFAVAAILTAALLSSEAIFASQGPGGGPGTASPFTQRAMAVIVYGGSAALVGAGLLGALRKLRGTAKG